MWNQHCSTTKNMLAPCLDAVMWWFFYMVSVHMFTHCWTVRAADTRLRISLDSERNYWKKHFCPKIKTTLKPVSFSLEGRWLWIGSFCSADDHQEVRSRLLFLNKTPQLSASWGRQMRRGCCYTTVNSVKTWNTQFYWQQVFYACSTTLNLVCGHIFISAETLQMCFSWGNRKGSNMKLELHFHCANECREHEVMNFRNVRVLITRQSQCASLWKCKVWKERNK